MSETITPVYEVTEEMRDELPTGTVRVKTTLNTISDDIGRIYHQVFSYLDDAGAQPAGGPFAWYHDMSGDEIDMEAGVPVGAPMAGNEQVKPSTLPGGPVAVVWYTGPYGDQMVPAYEAIEQWMNNNGFETAGGPWEFYWTDPAETAPEDYRTEIVWPIRKKS
jgi:effector-binding domain-containing protein